MYLLHTYPDRFVVDVDASLSHAFAHHDGSSASGSSAPDSLVIDRATGSMTAARGPQRPPQGAAFSERIDAIVGIITLLRGRYLIVCTGSKHVATVQGCPVRQLVDTKIIPFASDKYAPGLSSEQEKEEKHYLALLRTQLRCGFFYFSYDYDLTLTTQRIAAIRSDPEQSALPLWKRADRRFWWNEFLTKELVAAGSANGGAGFTDDFIVPLVNGYVFQQHQRIKGHDVTFVLLSRRSKERTGRRFVLRGLDQEGHAANFAEAEQVVFVTDPTDGNSTRVASFVQTRGSIPVLWEQPVTLKYTPKIHFQLDGTAVDLRDPQAKKRFEAATETACQKHFEAQTSIYGRQICLNLVNQKGAELALVKAFKQQVDHLGRQDVRLVNWDFHQECRKMKYENISKLCELVKDEVETQGYFLARVSSAPGGGSSSGARGGRGNAPRVSWSVTRRQTGTIRSNCIDCLDRTNVVQSVFARRALDAQLAELCGFHTGAAGGDKHPSLDSMFRNVWANNADAMSLQYSGTGALKTDYTRTGKRTMRGACMDGVNSLTRYALNNFADGGRQDATDLFLGLYQPALAAAQGEPSPYRLARARAHPSHQKSVWGFAWAFTLALALLLVAVTNLAPPALAPHRHWAWSTQLGAFVALDVALGAKLLMRYGRDYANKPVLRHAAARK